MTSNVTVWLAALMLVASVALFVAAPLTEVFSSRRRGTDDEARSTRLQHERGLATAALRELDFDHEMGKIADGDYHALRARLETRALSAMSGLSELGAVGANARIAPHGARPCPRCGTPPAAHYLFCPLCCAALDGPVGASAE